MMMMGFWFIVLLLLMGVGAHGCGWRLHLNQIWPAQTSQPPVEILKARYVRGEINREEYDQMRRDLEG